MADFQKVTAKLLDMQEKQARNVSLSPYQNQEMKNSSYGQELNDEVLMTDNVIGVYKGQEFQGVKRPVHKRADSHGVANQIVSQSKIIIPRGIINFRSKNVSIDRGSACKESSDRAYQNQQTPQFPKKGKCLLADNVQVTFNEVQHNLPNLAGSFDSNNNDKRD